MFKKLHYALLFLILLGAVFVRVYNTKDILGFYYDQGRDALVIWNFIHNKDIFLVGPTTGIEGILRGPWYYFLILPFYFLGGGNPVWPANFLALTSVGAIIVLYFLSKDIFGKTTGLIAATIAAFSYYLIVASRWLSNPTPMLLISMLLVWGMLMVTKGKKIAWVLVGAALGFAMQFGSATEAFYIPAVLIFAFWQRKNLPNKKIFFLSILTVFVIFLPQIIFDVVKGGVLTTAIKRFLLEESSFKLSFWEVVKVRLPFYWDMFSSKVWVSKHEYFITFFLASLSMILFNLKNLRRQPGFKILVLLGASPLVGMLFFQGNEGNVFDYYFTGYYLIYVLLFAIGLGLLAKSKLGLSILAIFFYLFLTSQLPVIKNYLVQGRSNVGFKEQLAAVDFVYTEAGNEEFNVDVYVPPVIPYAYDYLFLWRGKHHKKLPTTELVGLLYTVYEEDVPHRLEPWLDRQDKIGKVTDEVSFRGITVQKRLRL